MKTVIISFFLTLSVAFGYEPSPRLPELMLLVDSSSNNVPTAYDATAGSQLLTSVNRGVTRLQFFNTGAELLAVYVGKGPCASAPGDHFVVPSGGGNETKQVSPGDHICVRSLGSAQTTGLVAVSQW